MAKRISSKEVDEALQRLNALPFPPVEGSPEFDEVMQWYHQAHRLNYKKGMAASAGLICRLYNGHMQFGKMEPYLQEMKALCEENGNWTDMYADCLRLSIEVDFTFGRYDEAVATSNIFLSGLINELDPVRAMNCYIAISHLYQARGWYIRALRVCHQGMTRQAEFRKAYNASGLWINYAHALHNVKQYDSALKEFLAILESKDLRLHPHAKGHCYFYLSQIYAIGFGDNEKCVAYYDKAMEINNVHDSEATILLLNLGHAFSLNSLKRYEEALPAFGSELMIDLVKESITEHAALLNGKAWCLLNLHKTAEAWAELQQLEKMLDPTGDHLIKVSYYKNCAFYYRQIGNEAEATKNAELQDKAQEKANSLEFAMQLEQVDAMMELDKKKWELEAQKLKQEKMEQELNYASQEKEILNAAVNQRNALIDEFQAAIKKMERSDMKRAEIFKELSEKIVSVRNNNNEVSEHDLRFNEKYKKSSQLIGAKYPTLSAAEIKIAILLASGLSNKEIASTTLTTIRNVETHRLKIRKKMEIGQGGDLIKKIVLLLG